MGRGADARRGEIERAGFRLGGPDQIGSGLETLRGRCEQHARYDAKRRHRRKIARNIVVESRKKRWRDRMRGGIGKQRVAVGLGLCDGVGAGRRAGAWPVLDDDRLPKLDRELFEDDARNDVRRRTRTERHDHVQGPGRPILGTGRGECQGYDKRGGNEQPIWFHGVTRCFPFACGEPRTVSEKPS